MKPENDCRQSEVGKRVAAHPWIYRLSYHWQNILGVFGYAWHNSFADECTHDFACCRDKIERVTATEAGWIGLPPKCDGDHGAPACLDPGCWQNTPLPEVDLGLIGITLPDVKPGDPEPITTWETWMNEARQAAAQCWCHDETKDRVMDPVLAEVVAKAIANWMDCAAQAYRDVEFYRGIVVQIGTPFGVAARTSDDGSIQDDVLALKIPELVAEMREALEWMSKNRALIIFAEEPGHVANFFERCDKVLYGSNRGVVSEGPWGRDKDWVLAMGEALGMNSGFEIPIVPQPEPFRKLFTAIREAERNER